MFTLIVLATNPHQCHDILIKAHPFSPIRSPIRHLGATPFQVTRLNELAMDPVTNEPFQEALLSE